MSNPRRSTKNVLDLAHRKAQAAGELLWAFNRNEDGEEAVVANSTKALRENQEALDELVGGEGHSLAFVIVAIVLPALHVE